jgi:altronate hydrolase
MSVAPPLDRLGVLLHPRDDVLVATRDLQAGDSAGGLVVRASVPRGHKVAVGPIAEVRDGTHRAR